MNFIDRLRERRVPQIIGGYIAGGWALVQFLEFLEGRMTISPHLTNLIGLALLLLLPIVTAVAWIHGRPGRDRWGRTASIVLPVSLAAVVLLLVMVFKGQDFGAIIQTIEVEDEHGEMIERVIPKSEYRNRVLLFYPENDGSTGDDWARETFTMMLSMDLSQDVFINMQLPANMTRALKESGDARGHGLSRARLRKVARDAHIPLFLTGRIRRTGDLWTLTTALHESESGKTRATRDFEAPDLYALADLASLQLRRDLDVPSGHIDETQDLPVAELMSEDIEAVRHFVDGFCAMIHDNDWQGAAAAIDQATELDPDFAMAQFISFAVQQTLGDNGKAFAAIDKAMENAFQLPERTQLMIKATYYYNVKLDADKTMAVLDMWIRLYPDDVNAYGQKALYAFVHQDLEAAIEANEKILEIDPSQAQVMEQLADLHRQLADYDEAERYLLMYVERYPTRSDGFEDLGDFYLKIGELEKARTALDRAQLLDPDDLGVAISLSDLDLKLGRYDEADSALSALLAEAESPQDRALIHTHLLNLVMLRGQSARVSAALEGFYTERAEFQNPLQLDIMYMVSLPALSMAGRAQAALDRIEEVARRVPEPYDKMKGLGSAWALIGLGRLAEAERDLDAAREIADTFKFETMRSPLNRLYGELAEARGDYAEACALYRASHDLEIERDPSLPAAWGRALRLAGRPDEAEEVMTAALKLHPAHPLTNLQMAILLKEQGRNEKAREHLRTALAAWTVADPGFGPAEEARELEASFLVTDR